MMGEISIFIFVKTTLLKKILHQNLLFSIKNPVFIKATFIPINIP